jgi:hypothetical protein
MTEENDKEEEIPRNLFEAGTSQDSKFLLKYVKEIEDYVPSEYDGIDEFINFFISRINAALDKLGEGEETPDWVFNIEEYRRNNEILLAHALFRAVLELKNMPLGNSYEPEIRDDIPMLNVVSSDGSVRPSNPAIPMLMGSLFQALVDLGEERKWDLDVLRSQIFSCFGMNPSISVSEYIGPDQRVGFDYN